MIRICS